MRSHQQVYPLEYLLEDGQGRLQTYHLKKLREAAAHAAAEEEEKKEKDKEERVVDVMHLQIEFAKGAARSCRGWVGQKVQACQSRVWDMWNTPMYIHGKRLWSSKVSRGRRQ